MGTQIRWSGSGQPREEHRDLLYEQVGATKAAQRLLAQDLSVLPPAVLERVEDARRELHAAVGKLQQAIWQMNQELERQKAP